jgi:acetolactate synthase-1/2/3 large subunit
MQIQVSELIVRFMERLGIDTVFGMPGAHILPVYDGLYDSPIRTVLAKHEQGAAFMACGNSRASHKISGCLATAGPGATNLVTGIANAFADKLPVLAITGEAPTYIFGKGGLQESSGEGGAISQSELFRSITHYCKLIERTDYLPGVLNQAAKVLLADTPGPVLLSIPYNVQKEMVDEAILDQVITQKSGTSNAEAPAGITELARLLKSARHPVIIAGYGCIKSGAQNELEKLSSLLDIPVATSLKGKGAVDEQGPLSLGCLGVTTRGYAFNYIKDHADLILFLGAAFNERTSYVWKNSMLDNKKIAQVDNYPGQIEKVYRADLAICGDIHTVLTAVLEQIQQDNQLPGQPNNDDIEDIQSAQKKHNDSSPVFASGFELVEQLFRRMEHALPANSMIFDDNIIYAQNFFRVTRGIRYFPNSGISSLGHAVPAAIGARFSTSDPAVVIIGDGGFQMCCMEIMTAMNYGIPLTIILFNNSSMGLIRKNQNQQYAERYLDCDFDNPDYRMLAKSFGIDYVRVKSTPDLDKLFTNTTEQSVLIDVFIDKNAFPVYHSNR